MLAIFQLIFISLQSFSAIGGENLDRGEYPFVISIPNCSAIIYSEYQILTAAHCLEYFRSKIEVATYHTGKSETYFVEEAIAPLDYKRGGLQRHNFDLALITVNKSLLLLHGVSIAPITWEKLDYGENLQIVAFGKQSLRRRSRSRFHNPRGKIRYKQKITIPYIGAMTGGENIIALQNTRTKAVCYGDSGGPIIKAGKVIGIVFGVTERCGALNNKSLGIKLSYFKDWLEENSL